MAVTANPYFRAGVEFVHDVAAGAYPGAVLATWMTRRYVVAAKMLPAATPLLQKAAVGLWLVFSGTAFLLVVTGLFRLGYWQLNVRSGFLETKRRMVLVKHTAFVALLIASFVWMFTLLPA